MDPLLLLDLLAGSKAASDRNIGHVWAVRFSSHYQLQARYYTLERLARNSLSAGTAVLSAAERAVRKLFFVMYHVFHSYYLLFDKYHSHCIIVDHSHQLIKP